MTNKKIKSPYVKDKDAEIISDVSNAIEKKSHLVLALGFDAGDNDSMKGIESHVKIQALSPIKIAILVMAALGVDMKSSSENMFVATLLAEKIADGNRNK